MFTGIIEELGDVERVERAEDSARLTIHAPLVIEGTRSGDSIGVNGCCLTVVEVRADAFTADLMAETLRRTCLGELAPAASSIWSGRCARATAWAVTSSRVTSTPPPGSWSVTTPNGGTSSGSACLTI